MIILISIIITILLLVIAYKAGASNELVGLITFLIGIIGAVITIIFICVVVSVHLPTCRKAEYTRYIQRYNSIMYALENSSENVISLTEEISNYNTEVLNGRMIMDSKLLRSLEFDFYYDLPLVDITINVNKEDR